MTTVTAGLAIVLDPDTNSFMSATLSSMVDWVSVSALTPCMDCSMFLFTCLAFFLFLGLDV